ncbi:heme exporter protein A [Parasphingorhabdus marina DSM 22363]|uniref:Heme exporter protein A n=1 Tax=Parasphingorhabdus marina DSM 22363 TaxID=1123272 RepID=A0A1N6CSQ3_9SPHN|nr:heme ABC exporter ATP-binding protein CcmA [Parasphingorhabdus marina]SIN61590.1 heme exporter protein A [Parasphingorhabdus marina DSM 22363]
MNSGASTEIGKGSNITLSATGLSCVRGGNLLFRNLDLELRSGQAGMLTGPNGVGKSSLLRLIAGLLPAFAGEIQVTGSVALCDNKLALDEHLPLEAALQFWARMDGRNTEDVGQAMTAAGLAHLAEVPVRYFSTGQRQRARLARTFLGGADIWLLDEPVNGLDRDSVDQLGDVLQAHLQRGGIILAASHIPLPIPADLAIDLQPLEQELEQLDACL